MFNKDGLNCEGRRVIIWLAAVLGLHILIGIGITATLHAAGENLERAFYATAPSFAYQFLDMVEAGDSYDPMFRAHYHRVVDPTYRLYDIFFVDHVKFQYPPSSLLIFDLLPDWMTTTSDGNLSPTFETWWYYLSMVAVIVTILLSAIILEVRLAQINPDKPVRWTEVILRALLVAALGMTFYPLVRGHQLGQIQVFLGCLVALAILCQVMKWQALSGICLGLCCLVKPQCGVLLLWGLLRRRWRFSFWLLGVLLLGTSLALFRFGLMNHFDYVRVLRAISSTGETYWANQSSNGLMNRLLGNGDPLHFDVAEFAPYHALVYVFTLVTSVLILGIALMPWRLRRPPTTSSIDMGIALAAATMASPVAWEHHYGMFFPIFAVILPELLHFRPLGRLTLPLLALSYLAIAGVMLYPEAIFVNQWWGILGSHVYFGALIFFVLMVRLRYVNEAAGANSVP